MARNPIKSMACNMFPRARLCLTFDPIPGNDPIGVPDKKRRNLSYSLPRKSLTFPARPLPLLPHIITVLSCADLFQDKPPGTDPGRNRPRSLCGCSPAEAEKAGRLSALPLHGRAPLATAERESDVEPPPSIFLAVDDGGAGSLSPLGRLGAAAVLCEAGGQGNGGAR